MKSIVIFLFFLLPHFCFSQNIDDYLMSADDKIKNGDFKGALFDCNRAIDIKPKSAFTCYYRSMAKAGLHNYKGAKKDIKLALEIERHTDFYYQKGILEFCAKQYKSAWVDFSKAITMNSNNVMAYCYRSLVYSRFLHDYKNAIKDLDSALQIEKSDERIYFHRGKIKALLSDFKEALTDYDEAILINPYYAEAYFDRALINASLNRINDACFDMEIAKKLGEIDALQWIEKKL